MRDLVELQSLMVQCFAVGVFFLAIGVQSYYVVVLGALCLCKQTPIQEKEYHHIHEPEVFL